MSEGKQLLKKPELKKEQLPALVQHLGKHFSEAAGHDSPLAERSALLICAHLSKRVREELPKSKVAWVEHEGLWIRITDQRTVHLNMQAVIEQAIEKMLKQDGERGIKLILSEEGHASAITRMTKHLEDVVNIITMSQNKKKSDEEILQQLQDSGEFTLKA